MFITPVLQSFLTLLPLGSTALQVPEIVSPYPGATQHLAPEDSPLRRVADYDGDGHLDALASDRIGAPHELRLLLGDGTGRFLPAEVIDLAPLRLGGQAPVQADLDGDGVLDLALVLIPENQDARGYWMKGTSTPGNVSFADPERFTLLPVYQLVPVQYDSDPEFELAASWTEVFGSASLGRHGVWDWTPTGPQQAQLLVAPDGQVHDEVADLNGDGFDELLEQTFSSEDSFAYYVNLGGTFLGPEPQLEPTRVQLQMSTPDAIADFDLDGDIDLLSIAGSFGPDQILRLARNSGSGSLNPFTFVNVQAPLANGWEQAPASWRSRVLTADFDGDGFPDLGFQSSPAPSLGATRVFHFRSGFGDGTFGPPQVLPTVSGTAGASPLSDFGAVGDLNGDGIIDLIGAQSSVNGSSGAHPVADLDGYAALSESFTWLPLRSDLDGDGDLDRVDAIAGGVDWNDAAGNLNPGAALPPIPGLEGSTVLASIAGTDLDDDGRSEVLTQIADAGTVLGWRAYEYDAAGGFIDQGFVGGPSPQASGPVLALDVDGDGNQDLLHGAGYFPGDGSGALANLVTLFAGPELSTAIDVTDLESDGDLDYLVRAELIGGGQVLRLLRGSPGGLVPEDLGSFESLDRGTRLLDLDGDLDLDVVASGAPSGSGLVVRVYENAGGTFTQVSEQALPLLANVGSFGLADLNLDGTFDLLATSCVDGGLLTSQTVVLTGFGSAQFGEPSRVRTTWRGALLADMDQDGDLDSSGFLTTASSQILPPEGPQLLQYGAASPASEPVLPLLGAQGQFSPGSTNASLRLVNAPPAAPAFLATSASAAAAVDVPLPGLLALVDPLAFKLTLFATSGAQGGLAGSGGLFLPFVPAPGTAGLTVFAQVFVVAPSVPQGLVGSNGLQVTFGL